MNKSDKRELNRLQPWWLIPVGVVFFFLCGIVLLFPTEVLQQRLESELTTRLNHPVILSGLSLQIPVGVSIDELTSPSELGPIKFTDISITPSWSSLLSTTPAAQIAAQFFAGTIEAKIDTTQHIDLTATAIRWDGQIPQLPALNIQTTIAHLNIEGSGAENFQLEQLQLELSELYINGLKKLSIPIDHLELGTIKLKLSQKQQNIHLHQLTSSGGDIIISGGGHITQNSNFMRSRIDLEFTLTPRPDLDPAITSMLPLFAKEQQDGNYTVRLSGTLAQPRLR